MPNTCMPTHTHLAWNPVFHAQSKNIEVHYHFNQECVLTGDVDLKHISTNPRIYTKVSRGANTLYWSHPCPSMTTCVCKLTKGSIQTIVNNVCSLWKCL